jgi:hypothetical protein
MPIGLLHSPRLGGAEVEQVEQKTSLLHCSTCSTHYRVEQVVVERIGRGAVGKGGGALGAVGIKKKYEPGARSSEQSMQPVA